MTRTKPIGGLGLSEVNAAGLNCFDAWKAQKATLQIGLNTINSRLSSLIVSEFDDPKGCLADPGGVGGNICDWSYEKFAGEVLSFGEEDMQADFSLCNAATGGNFQEVRNQSLQKKVWPCELRQDFGIDQRNAAYYFDIRGDQVARFACEKERVKENLADYLKSWREVTKNIPVRETWVGESAGDKWQIGKKSTFGARLEYGVGWYVKGGAGGKRTGDNAWCKPIGEGSLTAKAALDFFGKELTVVDAAVVQTTKEAEATFRAHAMYRDFNKLSKTELTPLFPRIPTPPAAEPKLTEPRSFPLSQKLIGKVSYSMGFSVGPAVITVNFGVQAKAGIELKALGRPSATQCDSPPGNSETLSYNFSTGVEFEPFAQADVFAQAALELGIARGGVRVNVTLLRLGLPTGAAAEIEKGTEMSLRTGSSLAVRALSGSISAFVEVGICPLCGDREATLFSWRWLRQDIPLWGRRAGPFPVKVATLFADSNVTDANVECINKQNTGSLNASGIMLVGNTPATSVPIDRWWCLRTMHDKNACIPYGNSRTLPQDSKAAGRACAPLYTPLVGSQR
ncbi:MAG: hypothetical protein KF915_18720 [Polyangiaceae bacterium]|nr:hypothetical protein [Polyangiaceae bacterium]